MKQEDIIRMAREAGLIVDANQSGFDSVEAFAALVAAAEQKKWEDQTAIEIHEAILDEREACAKVCEPSEEHRREASWGYLGGEEGVKLLDAKAADIRARKQT
jgi:hypothetical protein